jgi:membrane protease YdiL (CAAX protease family)
VVPPVNARLSRAVHVGSVAVLPEGSRLSGVVTDATRSAKLKGRAHIAMRFDSLTPRGDDQHYTIRTTSVGRTAPATKKNDAIKIGAPAAGGAIIGAIAGGKKGRAHRHRGATDGLRLASVATDPLSDDSASAPDRHIAQRLVALIEVLICSDFLSQIAIGGTLTALGYQPLVDGRLNIFYVVVLSIGDAVLLIGLIVLMLNAHGERPRDVIFGSRPVAKEIGLGMALVWAALAIGATLLLAIQRWAPSLHTVPNNPLQELLRSPRDAWLFALVVLVAGGIREEIQRAFLLHRFSVWLGGPAVGMVVTSIVFGAGHLMQGLDAAIATGVLGAFWGIVYLRRRSAIAPMVSHAGFDLLQIAQFIAVGT